MRLISFLLLLFIGTTTFAQCDTSRRPVVFVHGFLASGDTWSAQVQRFEAAGYCADRLFAFDWNTVGGSGKRNDSLLRAFIDEVIRKTGSAQVDLVGHSAGGGLARGYLLDPASAAKVAHYVHIGSRKWFADLDWFPNTRCLVIFSKGDKVAGGSAGEVSGARNLELTEKDHYQVATSEETFRAMYAFFNEGHAASNKAADKVSIGGRAVQLGDNLPMKDALVRVYPVSRRTGKRQKGQPLYELKAGPLGHWGPVAVNKDTYYEIELVPADAQQRRISYYFEPFRTPDHLVYLRGFPQGNLAGNMLGELPSKDDRSLLVLYNEQAAVVAGRDSLTLGGQVLSTAQLTPAQRTIIAFFLYDDGDGRSSGLPLKQYSLGPFIGGADMFLPTGRKKFHELVLNGRRLAIPAVPSSQRILLAVYR